MTDKPITAYKGFDADLKCRGFQFEVGKTYEHQGDVVARNSGFHACEHPLDVFGFYPPSTSRFALVALSGDTDRDNGSDTKIAAAIIEIEAELHIHEVVAAAVKHVFGTAKWIRGKAATGYQGAASATGYRGAAMSSGRFGAVSGAVGNALFLCERNEHWEIISVWAGIVGKDGIEPNTFYRLIDGTPAEVSA